MRGPLGPTRAIERFFAPQPMQALVVCRIGFGLILFVSYAAKLPRFQMLFGPDGVGGSASLERSVLADVWTPLAGPFGLLRYVPSSELVWLLAGVVLAASLCFALGFRTRTAGVIALLLHLLFHARNEYAFYGWAVMMKPYMLYVILAPVGRYASIDAWLRRRRDGTPAPRQWIGPAVPLRLLQVHLCTMYAVAGWARLTDPGWLGGEMLFVALTDRRFARLDFDWYPYKTWLTAASYWAFVAEPLAPFLLWIKSVGAFWALGLMSLHLGLELFANVGWWQYMMMTGLVAFLPPDWVAAAFPSLRRPSS
ncbi:MAG: HTTM domain-containing protein [Proteobacteria bacterium]|nr:HTTM domain-containing protein [Pseudomonadota bacterium]